MDSIRNREASASAAAAAAALNLNLDLNIDPTSDHHHHYPATYDHGEEEEEEEYDDDDDDDGYLANELNRMNAEHEKLLHDLTLISKHHLNLLNLIQDHDQDQGSLKKPRDSSTVNNKIYRQIHPCDTTLIVKDGYQWRKYGQKVTRDNPSPRAYYKCSFAPNCPVKKKVQKSLHDPSLLIAIYQGEHNHPPPDENEVQLASNLKNAQNLISKMFPKFFSSDLELPLEKFLIDHMASSLIHNSNFTTSLATAIFEKMLGDELFE